MLMIALLVQAATPTAAPASDCSYDRAAMMALDELAFDQDMTGGWRALNNIGCDGEAADLIRDWREAHAGDTLRNRNVLFWHEGQLRGNAGQIARAIALFDRSHKPASEDAIGWNHYVDGSIAFLRGDRRAFDVAYARLAALPRPADFDPRGPDGKPRTVVWPMNLSVLDGFRRCWGQPYKQAYSCGVPMYRVTVPAK